MIPAMHVVQILPALNEGGVERGTDEFSRELVRRGPSFLARRSQTTVCCARVIELLRKSR
jgi:hypothetical protein